MAASIAAWKGSLCCLRSHYYTAVTKGVFCPNASKCALHTSQGFQVDRRKDRALIQHLHYLDHEKSLQHRNSPLVQLPDYSYVDGRPTEFSICQKQRKEKNYLMAKQIVQLVGEMKFAQEELKSQESKILKAQQQRLDSRLKEKSVPLKH